MRLIEETDGEDCRKSKKKRREAEGGGAATAAAGKMGGAGGGGGGDWVCCVCMERDKGAAFIPCGHTFCRICSKDLWARRGCCPICNRQITEILDIY
ncbi:Probable E3 ubiquitin-protein ligase XBOS34 [Linum perenne]